LPPQVAAGNAQPTNERRLPFGHGHTMGATCDSLIAPALMDGAMYTPHKDFLLAEYKASIDVILGIEGRRATFLSYYALMFGAVASIGGTIFARFENALAFETVLALAALFTVTSVVGVAVIWVLMSERGANVRYRIRINEIRTILLSSQPPTTDGADVKELSDPSTQTAVAAYLQRETHNPKGIGRTLKFIFFAITVQVLLSIGAAAAIVYYRLDLPV